MVMPSRNRLDVCQSLDEDRGGAYLCAKGTGRDIQSSYLRLLELVIKGFSGRPLSLGFQDLGSRVPNRLW